MENTWILYQTTNELNGKIYIGVHKLANTSKSRWYLGSGESLNLAIKKYGRKNFVRQTLEEFNSAEEAYQAEARNVTEEFCSRFDTYNISCGGRGGNIQTDATKAKISAANKGKKRSEETKAKIALTKIGNKNRLGKPHTKEAKIKIGSAQIGHKRWVGKQHKEESLAKMSVSQKQRTASPETKALMSASRKGKSYEKIAVVINGKYYLSTGSAALAEKLNPTSLRKRVRSNDFKWVDWRFATEEEKLANL